MSTKAYKTLHQHLVREVRRRAEQAGEPHAIVHDKSSIYAKAIAAADSLKGPAELVALHKVFGSDFGTILHTAIASYVRDYENA